MRTWILSILTLTGMVVLASAQSAGNPPALPPGHPAPPGQGALPPGHPPVEESPFPADPADVATVDAALDAYYASISGPKGAARDWARFQSLFVAEARFISLKPSGPGESRAFAMTTSQYIDFTRTYFERGGYFERDIHREIDQYRGIAQVFSTYESRRVADQPAYARGINSFQLIHDGKRWWITTMSWQLEAPGPDGEPIPAAYLPASSN